MPGDLVKCQFDSYLQELDTVVRSCVAAKQIRRNANEADKKQDAASGGKGKDGKGAPAKGAVDTTVGLFEVVLEDTILFPEGGGQPADMGWINDELVEYVFRAADGAPTHLMRLKQPLTTGQKMHVKLDWSRRFDHMQHHSGQHLLSALAVKLFGWPTKSWWLSRAPAECHIEFGVKTASEEQLLQLEQEANRMIREGVLMKAHVFDSLEEAMKDDNFRSRKITKDGDADNGDEKAAVAELHGQLRMVEIAGTDFNTCCGTHVASTAHIQLVKFTSTQPSRGNTRVFFVAGDRALSSFGRMCKTEAQLVTLLSTQPAEHVEAIKRMQTDLRAANKSLKAAQAEVASLLAAQLLTSTVGKVKPVLVFHRDDETFPAADLLDAIEAKAPTALTLVTLGNPKGSGQFMLAGPADAVANLGPKVGALLGGRGGGRKGRYQGKAENLSQADAAVRALTEAYV